MSDPFSDLSDEALSRRLATELPRHVAPARLRVAIVEATTPQPARRWWFGPAVTAAATALLLVLFFIPLLPRFTPQEPVQRLARAVVSEHTRALLWGARVSAVVPAGLPELTQETGINLSKVFVGDSELTLVAAEPVYLDQRRGVAVHYRNAEGHHVSYVVLPGAGVGVPERQRVTIGRFRPALLHDSGYSLWVWKQGELACFLVSDIVGDKDLDNFKDYFVRVRTAMEPVPAY